MRNLARFAGLSPSVLAAAAVLGLTALTPVPAEAYWRGGWHGGWGWGWGLGAGVGIAAADAALWGWPYRNPYYPAYPYYAAPSVTVVAPQTVTAVPAAPAAPPPPTYYYCTNPQGYYPYVPTCQVPWRAVPPAPPAAP